MKNHSAPGFALISILIFLSCSCQKEPVTSSGSSLYLDASSYELKNAYYTNNWGSHSNMGGELILTGPTIYFDGPTGFFNSSGKSAFVIIINSELDQLKSGDYDLSPNQTIIQVDASPKPTDSVGVKSALRPVGDLIEGKMKITEKNGVMAIEITGACYVNKVRTVLNITFTGSVSKIPEPYHLKN